MDDKTDIDALRKVAVLAGIAYDAFPGRVPGDFGGMDPRDGRVLSNLGIPDNGYRPPAIATPDYDRSAVGRPLWIAGQGAA